MTQEQDNAKLASDLAERIARLTPLQIGELRRQVSQFEFHNSGSRECSPPQSKHWPHAPLHRLGEKGTFIVTGSTLYKEHHFQVAADLDFFESELLSKADDYGWQIEAWACFSNHYHFVGHSLNHAKSLKPFISHLHADTARELNVRYSFDERQVWYNFWETELTFEKSYLARLNYVHQNAVKHGLVPSANMYRWCSAAWFERTAKAAQVKTIYSFKLDSVRVQDDFDVVPIS